MAIINNYDFDNSQFIGNISGVNTEAYRQVLPSYAELGGSAKKEFYSNY